MKATVPDYQEVLADVHREACGCPFIEAVKSGQTYEDQPVPGFPNQINVRCFMGSVTYFYPQC